MSTVPYHENNDEIFEAITRQLNEALRRVEKDSSLSASVSSLARLSGVHRNTIYNRKWPQDKLKEIKEKRAQQKREEKILKAVQKSPEELLELCRLEVIYWFTQLQDARSSVSSLSKKNKETESSRNFYLKLSQERLEEINRQANEIMKLRDALELQEDEIARLKKLPDI